MIVEKAVNMANMMDIEVLGLIENYSYIECPDCKKQISVFGESKVDEVAKKYNLEVLGKLPIDPSFASLCDKGCLEDIEINYLDKANEKLEQLPITIMNVAIPVDGNEIDHHFGKAKLFYVYQIVKDMIAGAFKLQIEEQGHINVVDKLKENQVHVVLCNHLGEEALDYATFNNIRIVSGFDGNPIDAIRNFLQGKTESEGANCDDCDCGGDCSDCGHSGCGGCH
jgi:predicted Fe-Mo cluster-binding NifX family protein